MEERFEFVNDWPEWSRENFAESERISALGAQLWGHGKIENLQRQLELPSPEIPPGLGMKELTLLEQRARMMLAAANHRWMLKFLTNVVTVGPDQFTVAEAMYEIVRRAIVALGN
ncbi:MAG: hypothetical protein WA020_00130 [Candidatus Acidiferrales bacterium]